MFQPTKPHKQEIKEKQSRLRLGHRVPNDAVSLAYVYNTPLMPIENVQVTDLSGFVLENVLDQNLSDIDLWPNDQGLLTSWDGEPYVQTRSFSLTNEFMNNVPLYYVHELRYPILDTSGKRGYVNNSISVVDGRGNELPSDHLYKVTATPTDEPNIYKIRIFTNFQKQPSETVKAVYTAYKDGRIIPGYNEQLNPFHAFEKSTDIHEVSLEPGKTLTYYQAYGKDIGQSQVYVGIVPIRELDWRKPHPFRYRVQATASKGEESKTIITPWIYDTLFARSCLSEADIDYRNGYKMLGGKYAIDHIRAFGDTTLFDDPEADVHFEVEASEPHITIYTQTDGHNHVLAYTDKATDLIPLPANFRTQYRAEEVPFGVSIDVDGVDVGTITDSINILEGHRQIAGPFTGEKITISLTRPYDPVNIYVKDNSVYAYTEHTDIFYVPRFSMQTSNNRQIRVLAPAEKYATENWYLRVKNGQFTRLSAAAQGFNMTHFYSIPEYFKQDFSKEFGMPIRKVLGEQAEIIGDRKIRVRYAPLYIRQDKESLLYNIVITVNGIPTKLVGWLSNDGIIEVDMKLKENDNVIVDYFYEELSFTYRGYWDEESRKFWNLDLNPGTGHYYTDYNEDTEEIVEAPTLQLINKTVYLYLKPSAKFSENKEMVRGSYNPYCLYHTFKEIDESNHILLAKIQVRPNSNFSNMHIIDTRVRGGGLKPTIGEDLMKAIETDSASYWDVGYWDGEPYAENGVVIVRLPNYLLREHGGHLSKEEIEEKVKKHIGFGNLPLIEYVEEPRKRLSSPGRMTFI